VNGGFGLSFARFEFFQGGAWLRIEDCLFGNSEYEYQWSDVEETILEPVAGTHEYPPSGMISKIVVEAGADCSVLTLRVTKEGGKEYDLFASYGAPLQRGDLCLECADGKGTFGEISDCGVPVPWTGE
jgi:hypothetical protein